MVWEQAAGLIGKKMKAKTPIERARAFAKMRDANAPKPRAVEPTQFRAQKVTWGNKGVAY